MKGYRYRIYPNKTQQAQMNKHFGASRHVYNWALAQKIAHYEETGKSLNCSALQKLLVASKKTDKPWLSEVNSQTLLAALLNLDRAFTHFFKGHAKFPQKKKRYAPWQSYQCPQHVTVDFAESKLHLPKIKDIKAHFHREFRGIIKTVTIKRSPTHQYYASILVDDGFIDPIPTTITPQQTIGIDLGISHFLITSEGEKIDNPQFLKSTLSKLREAQRKLFRKKKASINRSKAKTKVAHLHEKVANKRNDFLHQVTRQLIDKNHATSFGVEDLSVKNMVKNRKLARAISDCGWGGFVSRLTYKCRWQGKNVITIGRFAPSSKTCSHCGAKQEKMPLATREWTCACGAFHDRDINAAKMIRRYALAQQDLAEPVGSTGCVKMFPYCDTGSDSAIAKEQTLSVCRVAESPH